MDETLFGEPLSKRLMARKQERYLLHNQITYENEKNNWLFQIEFLPAQAAHLFSVVFS